MIDEYDGNDDDSGPITDELIRQRMQPIPSGTSKIASVDIEDDDDDDDTSDITTHRRRRSPLPIRTILLAVFLLCFGIGFSIAGITLSVKSGIGTALPFVLIGGLTIIPGAYASVIIALTLRGVEGYSFQMIPNVETED